MCTRRFRYEKDLYDLHNLGYALQVPPYSYMHLTKSDVQRFPSSELVHVWLGALYQISSQDTSRKFINTNSLFYTGTYM